VSFTEASRSRVRFGPDLEHLRQACDRAARDVNPGWAHTGAMPLSHCRGLSGPT
jgi:hypothetical protein